MGDHLPQKISTSLLIEDIERASESGDLGHISKVANILKIIQKYRPKKYAAISVFQKEIKNLNTLFKKWVDSLNVNDRLDVYQRKYQTWCLAEIKKLCGTIATIHYVGWNKNLDENIDLYDADVALAGAFTSSSQQKEVPKTTSPGAPTETEKDKKSPISIRYASIVTGNKHVASSVAVTESKHSASVAEEVVVKRITRSISSCCSSSDADSHHDSSYNNCAINDNSTNSSTDDNASDTKKNSKNNNNNKNNSHDRQNNRNNNSRRQLRDGSADWIDKLSIGDELDVYNRNYAAWFLAKIKKLRGTIATIHYAGWSSKDDEEIDLSRTDVALAGVFTRPSEQKKAPKKTSSTSPATAKDPHRLNYKSSVPAGRASIAVSSQIHVAASRTRLTVDRCATRAAVVSNTERQLPPDPKSSTSGVGDTRRGDGVGARRGRVLFQDDFCDAADLKHLGNKAVGGEHTFKKEAGKKAMASSVAVAATAVVTGGFKLSTAAVGAEAVKRPRRSSSDTNSINKERQRRDGSTDIVRGSSSCLEKTTKSTSSRSSSSNSRSSEETFSAYDRGSDDSRLIDSNPSLPAVSSSSSAAAVDASIVTGRVEDEGDRGVRREWMAAILDEQKTRTRIALLEELRILLDVHGHPTLYNAPFAEDRRRFQAYVADTILNVMNDISRQ